MQVKVCDLFSAYVTACIRREDAITKKTGNYGLALVATVRLQEILKRCEATVEVSVDETGSLMPFLTSELITHVSTLVPADK
jgi:hypothetical protein